MDTDQQHLDALPAQAPSSTEWDPTHKPSEQSILSARIRMRIKGQTDGPIFQGQEIIVPCQTCGPPKVFS